MKPQKVKLRISGDSYNDLSFFCICVRNSKCIPLFNPIIPVSQSSSCPGQCRAVSVLRVSLVIPSPRDPFEAPLPGTFWHLLTTTRPSVLDSFALLSGQLNTLNKVLKHEKTPLFRNQVIIPLVLSPDRDEDLMVRGGEGCSLGNNVLMWGLTAQWLVSILEILNMQ